MSTSLATFDSAGTRDDLFSLTLARPPCYVYLMDNTQDEI
jgi:hypothetical protein